MPGQSQIWADRVATPGKILLPVRFKGCQQELDVIAHSFNSSPKNSKF